MPRLRSWSGEQDDEIRGFAGIATYTTDVVVPPGGPGRHARLSLGRSEAPARVWMNGMDCGVAWTAPWAVDVSRAIRTGRNLLRIEVASTWPNALIVDRKRPAPARRYHSNITKLPNAWTFEIETLPTDKYPLRPAGLVGPVRVEVEGAPNGAGED
jgi:hypothetical protein